MKDIFDTTIQERLALKRVGMEPDILSASFRIGMRDMGYEAVSKPEDPTGTIHHNEESWRYFRVHERAIIRVAQNPDVCSHLYSVVYMQLDNGYYCQQQRGEWVNTLDELYQYVQLMNGLVGIK